LAKCGLLEGERNNGVLDLLRHPILEHRLLAADLLQRQFASVVMVSSMRRGGALRHPDRSAPRLGL
jgi:hypothetical protein